MSKGWFVCCAVGVLLTGGVMGRVAAQQSAPAPRPAVSSERAPEDAKKIERGRKAFRTNCSFCHGEDARGGETGPNLVRSQIVLDDKNGELVGEIVRKGLPERGMPPIGLDAEGIEDVVQFLHSLQNPRHSMNSMEASPLYRGRAADGSVSVRVSFCGHVGCV